MITVTMPTTLGTRSRSQRIIVLTAVEIYMQ
jgi:hypothetical protein